MVRDLNRWKTKQEKGLFCSTNCVTFQEKEILLLHDPCWLSQWPPLQAWHVNSSAGALQSMRSACTWKIRSVFVATRHTYRGTIYQKWAKQHFTQKCPMQCQFWPKVACPYRTCCFPHATGNRDKSRTSSRSPFHSQFLQLKEDVSIWTKRESWEMPGRNLHISSTAGSVSRDSRKQTSAEPSLSCLGVPHVPWALSANVLTAGQVLAAAKVWNDMVKAQSTSVLLCYSYKFPWTKLESDEHTLKILNSCDKQTCTKLWCTYWSRCRCLATSSTSPARTLRTEPRPFASDQPHHILNQTFVCEHKALSFDPHWLHVEVQKFCSSNTTKTHLVSCLAAMGLISLVPKNFSICWHFWWHVHVYTSRAPGAIMRVFGLNAGRHAWLWRLTGIGALIVACVPESFLTVCALVLWSSRLTGDVCTRETPAVDLHFPKNLIAFPNSLIFSICSQHQRKEYTLPIHSPGAKTFPLVSSFCAFLSGQ